VTSNIYRLNGLDQRVGRQMGRRPHHCAVAAQLLNRMGCNSLDRRDPVPGKRQGQSKGNRIGPAQPNALDYDKSVPVFQPLNTLFRQPYSRFHICPARLRTQQSPRPQLRLSRVLCHSASAPSPDAPPRRVFSTREEGSKP